MYFMRMKIQYTLSSPIIVNKKLSYRRDSPRWRSLRSRSFKVTDFDTSRKPVCDLMNYELMNNTSGATPLVLSRIIFLLSRLCSALSRIPQMKTHMLLKTPSLGCLWVTCDRSWNMADKYR